MKQDIIKLLTDLQPLLPQIKNESPKKLGKQGGIGSRLSTPVHSTSLSINNNVNSPTSPLNFHTSQFPFSYELLSDTADFLLSIYELTHLSQETYFDVNQRIITIFIRISFIGENREMLRNTYEAIRAIFLMFGWKKENNEEKGRAHVNNKLLMKIVGYFTPNNTFMMKAQLFNNTMQSPQLMTSHAQLITQKSYSNKFYHLILKTRTFQSRLRSRFYYGLCCMLSYLQPSQSSSINLSSSLVEHCSLLTHEIFTVLENANQCDINLECFNALKVLVKCPFIDFHSRNVIIKKWTTLLAETSYKKQYLEYFITILDEAARKQQGKECSFKMKFYIGTSFMQITKNIQQQFSRFVIYKLACRNIMGVSKEINYNINLVSKNGAKVNGSIKGSNPMIILNIFHYSWFLDRVKQQNDLFRSEFLIFLLHSYFSVNKLYPSSKNQILDLIGLCHRLIDWESSNKEPIHIPTIKFAFDMYLGFLKIASGILGDDFKNIIVELMQNCVKVSNFSNLFKLKLISTIVSLKEYKQSWKQIKNELGYGFDLKKLISDSLCSIITKNPKSIFNFEYSQTPDGIIQSRKQIDFVKLFMQLLNNLQKSHQQMNQETETALFNYHSYLNKLEAEESNKDLIYCLQTGTADQYFSECQRNFLLSLIDEFDIKNNNFQLNLDENLLYSPYQSYESYYEDEINIFGPMSPVQLTIKIHEHINNSHGKIFLQVKKNNWVSCPKLKLIISSGMEKKQMVFESGIVEIRVDRVGAVHFEVWTADGNELLVGSGNLKIKRRLKWRKVNYLGFLDGIKRKSYFKKINSSSLNQSPVTNKSQTQNSISLEQIQQSECYLSYYYGQPLFVQIFRNCNEVVFGVSNKQVWNQLQIYLPDIIEEFSEGSAYTFQ